MKKRSTVYFRIIAAFAVFAMVFCMAGCSGDDSEGTSSESKNNKNSDGTYFDNGDTFCRGVWAVDDGEQRVGYYIFYNSDSGRFDDAHLGMSVPFEVKINGNAADFALGASDFTDPTSVEISAEGKRSLTWTNENRVEYLTLLGQQEPDSFSFFTQNDLTEIAMDYYEQNAGKRPGEAQVTIGVDGMAVITLLNRVGGNGIVIAEYNVDSITGKGTVSGKDEEIVFVKNDDND